jgi:Ring finger domain
MSDFTRLLEEVLLEQQRSDNTLQRIVLGYNENIHTFTNNLRICIEAMDASRQMRTTGSNTSDTGLSNISYEIYQTLRGYNENMNLALNLIQNNRYPTATQAPRYTHTAPTTQQFEVTYTLFPTRSDSETSVLLTADEIANATESVIFSETDEPSTCPIALENFVVGETLKKIRHCGHAFKSDALDTWFTRSTCCPVCRHNLKSRSTIPNTRPTTTIIPPIDATIDGIPSIGAIPPIELGAIGSNRTNTSLFTQQPVRDLRTDGSGSMDTIDQQLNTYIRTMLYSHLFGRQ